MLYRIDSNLFLKVSAKVAAAFIHLIPVLAILAVRAHAASENATTDESAYQQQLEAKRAVIDSLDEETKANAKARQQLADSLKNIESGIGERSARLQELKQETKRYQKQLERFAHNADQLQDALAEERVALAAIMQSRSRPNHQSSIKLLLSNRDPHLASRQSVYLGVLQQARLAHVEELLQRLETAETARQEALKSRNWLGYLQKKANSQHQALNTRAKGTVGELNELQQDNKSNSEQKERLLAEILEVEDLLAKLKKTKATASGYFEAGKRKHPWPVSDSAGIRLYSRFDDPRASGKLRWKGLLIAAPIDSPVSAIADGEVVYAAELADMGIVVVLQHGDDFLSLYGGNRKSVVAPGDWVETGSTIATVGSNTGPNRHGVYLEIRKNAIAVDPEKWLDAKKSIRMAKK